MDSQSPSVFTFGIDEISQSHFISIAKWNRFMAIVGIVGSILSILLIAFGGSYFINNLSTLGGGSLSNSYAQGSLAGAMIFYILVIVAFLVPCFFRLKFANKMLKALAASDQELLNESLRQFKIYSTYWGILTILMIAFYALMFVLVIVAIGMAGSTRF